MNTTYHVCNRIETGDPLHISIADASSTENSRCIDGYSSYADPFLHDLKPNDKLNTSTCVQFTRADAKKHGKVRLGFGCLSLQLGDIADVLKLGFSLP